MVKNLYAIFVKKYKKLVYNPYKKMGINWLQIKKLKHQDYNNPGKINFYGNQLNYLHPPEVIYSLKEFFINNIYKINFENETPFIIDCGANIGFSIIALKLQYPNSKIVAFEPDEINYSLLQKNTKTFDNITLLNKGVWNNDTTLQFNMKGTQGSSSINADTGKLKEINVVSLKPFLQQTVDFLKIDIEGAEYEVLLDCKDDLKNVKRLFVEYHGIFEEQYKFYEIIDILKSNNYKVYIKEADNIYPTPFAISKRHIFDQQYNIFAFK